MLLQRLRDYANRPAVDPSGASGVSLPFHQDRVCQWQINLDASGVPRTGNLQQLVLPDSGSGGSGGSPRGVVHRVPAIVRTVGVAANLAADDVQYVLGWSDENSKPARVAQCHAAFTDLIHQWAASPQAVGDTVAAAVSRFYRDGGPATLTPPESFSAKDRVVIFVDGVFAHQAPSAAAFWSEEVIRRKCSDRTGLCLVCGTQQRLLDTVPSKLPARLLPGATNDASLVSVNEPVFGYDLTTQLVHTPLCLDCGEATITGLQELLDPARSLTFPGQDSRMTWWTVGGEDTTIGWVRKPDVERIRQLLQSPLTPDRRVTVDPATARGEFYSVTVGGNVARVMVRDWIEMPLAEANTNVVQWFADHEIVSLWGRDRVHSVGRLARVTGRYDRKTGDYLSFEARGANRPDSIVRTLMRAALRGTPLPLTVLTHLLNRIRADGHVDDARAALLRLALVRSDLPAGATPMPILDPTNTTPAYVAGRLFAVYEQLQHDAHADLAKPGTAEGATDQTSAGNNSDDARPQATEARSAGKSRKSGGVNASYGLRYFPGALANPRPALLVAVRLSEAWLHKLRRRGSLGEAAAINHRKHIDSLQALLTDDSGYPTRLNPHQQSLFALGRHHQRAETFAQRTRKPQQ